MELTGFASTKLWKEYIMSPLYERFRLNSSTCYVRLSPEEPSLTDTDLDREGITPESRARLRKEWILPRLSRTRTVTLQRDMSLGLYLAKCTCGFVKQHSLCCRHIYAALDIQPDKFHIRDGRPAVLGCSEASVGGRNTTAV